MPQTTLCPRCGKELAPHASGCSGCGNRPKERGVNPLGLLLVAFALCVAGLFLWGLYSSGGGTSSQANRVAAGSSAATDSETPNASSAGRASSNAEPAPALNLGLSVEEAYAAIPHRRTVMNFADTKIPEADKEYLRRVFNLVDQFIVLRVEAFQKFSRGDMKAAQEVVEEMERARLYLASLEPPSHLNEYHQLMLQALRDERSFYLEWAEVGRAFQYGQAGSLASHAKVQSASSAIRRAYGILIERYGNEAQHNKEAIFDYHCALDFI